MSARCIGMDEINIENEVSALYLWYVCANCTKAIELAKDSPSKIKKFNNLVVKFLEDEIIQKKPNGPQNVPQDSCVGISQLDMMPHISIRDPVFLTNTKGRPKNANRIKSSLELAKKKRTCSHCKGLGHYATGCPSRKVFFFKLYDFCNLMLIFYFSFWYRQRRLYKRNNEAIFLKLF